MIICIQYQKWLRTPSFHRKCFPLVAHTKINVLAVFFKAKLNQTVYDVIHVLKKSNHTSQPMCNIRISYFIINKRANLFADIMLSNILEVFMHFWTEWRGVKRVTIRGYVLWYIQIWQHFFHYHIDSRFDTRCEPLCTPYCSRGPGVVPKADTIGYF